MAAPTDNILQTVTTYQPAKIAFLLNSHVGISKSNKKFKDFDTLTANLGDAVDFELSSRATTGDGLVVSSFQKTEQRFQKLVCSQAAYSSAAYTSQQMIFQAEDHLPQFFKSRVQEIGTKIESDILKNIVSGVIVTDPQHPSFGQNITPDSGPYRFVGNGIDPINSHEQLAQALANFRDYGASQYETCGILPMTVIPPIIASGLTQFATNRNNEESMSWDLGAFSGASWYESNLLPIHTAGTIGETDGVMTVVSTNDPTGAKITQVTFSNALLSDANAIKSGDLLQFQDGVTGQPNLRYLTWIGHVPSSQSVQIRATSDAVSDGAGLVTVNIFPALQVTTGLNQNLSTNVVAGMEAKALPSHRAGVIWSGDPFYMAMPKLDNQEPFPTVTHMDPDSGASLRSYWGTKFGENFKGYVTDCIWGSTLIAENSMRVIFPLSQ